MSEASAFALMVSFVLAQEGGYCNDPYDRGGETKYGICKAQYPKLDIPSLTRDEAIAIYRRDYWERIKAVQMPEPIGMFAFECAVNQGQGASIRMLQKALGFSADDVDGIAGPVTLARAATCDVNVVLAEFGALRAMRYVQAGTFGRHGLGWMRRLSGSLVLCTTLAERIRKESV